VGLNVICENDSLLSELVQPAERQMHSRRKVLPKGTGDCIRPVSARPTAEVSFSEYRYENNASPKLLDIVDVPLLDAEPRHHQVENHVIDSGQRWVKRDELPFEALEELCDHPASLWINSDSTNAGCYDCISQAEAATVHDSLLLIKPREFLIE